VRSAVTEEGRLAAKSGGSAVTSAAVLLLILAPAFAVITSAEALPHGGASARPQARANIPTRANTPARADGTTNPPADANSPADAASGPMAGEAGPAEVASGQVEGLRLLREAAAASRAVAYEGVQIVSWWGPAGAATTVVHVAHEPGQGTVLRTADTDAEPAGESFVADGRGAQPDAVLGVTRETLGLLVVNYRVIAVGSGSACGRPTAIVEARRADGTTAARFWLDDTTKIPLRRELFDDRSQMINENTFIDLAVNGPVKGSLRVRPLSASRPWNVLTVADMARLRASGWPLPGHLPGALTLFNARQAATPAGPVLQLGYSDGLAGVSLFVQRGGLQRRLPGWRKIKVAGRAIYARDALGHGLTWTSHGYVLTLIADAPAVTITAAVRALPHEPSRGFWARVRHGFGRLLSWVDPFG